MTQCHIGDRLEGEIVPKPTFFNLSKEKRETLMKAAIKEFSRVPLNDALIANIVKFAGIPRGSFYQYFEDKEDLFFYLLDQYAEENKESFILSLEKANGDLFDTFIVEFKRMIVNFRKKENRDFFKNAFLNMNHKVETAILKSSDEEKFYHHFIDIKNFINISKLNIADEHELLHVIQILMAVTMHNLIQNFARELPFEDSLKNYTLEIELLKKGLCKKIDG